MTPNSKSLRAASFLLLAVLAGAQAPPAWQEILNHISAQSLEGHVSFLASDLLEGRDTPSRGLDIAAEYIASQFRAAGLEPAGDDGYFQTANRVNVVPNTAGFKLAFNSPVPLVLDRTSVLSISTPKLLVLERAPLVRVTAESLKSAALTGKVAVAVITDRRAALRLRTALFQLRPLAIVFVSAEKLETAQGLAARLEEAGKDEIPVPYVRVVHAALAKLIEAAPPGPLETTVSLRLPADTRSPVKLRNVIGILRGSDLGDTCVLLSAHYDHVGLSASGSGDRIFNGANDDSSGVAAMLETARALASAPTRPRRSIVFIAFFGEEKGMLGSKHYVEHPAFPLAKTVADLNLEHMGRSDAEEGPQAGRLSLTGMDFSNIGATLEAAGQDTGVKVYRSERYSDPLFANSDNLTFAEKGIPAHTLVAVYMFPDYHKVSDHWDKLDYANMEKVTRTAALGLLRIADSPEAPKWDASNPKAARFAGAAERLKDPARSGN